jgi:hypothetical protein
MEHRTRRWDKETGELIEDDKVRMTSSEMQEGRVGLAPPDFPQGWRGQAG